MRVVVAPAALAALAFAILLSLAVGARAIPFSEVVEALFGHLDGGDAAVVNDVRLPRTALGLLVGVALGLAGALMQALTRNPLADPGLLGVNAGASAAVVTAIGLLGITQPEGYVWFSFLGAALASVLVYAIGSAGPRRRHPGAARARRHRDHLRADRVRLRRSRSRTRCCCRSTTSGRSARSAGAARPSSTIALPFVVLGALAAVFLARPLNALALGDDQARALGTHAGRTRIAGAVAITLLAGAATAAAGPIAFVGLTVPHVARAIAGTDQRWVLAYSALLGAILVLVADSLGRLLARPGEVQAGIVMAFVGVPIFISVVRRRRIAEL